MLMLKKAVLNVNILKKHFLNKNFFLHIFLYFLITLGVFNKILLEKTTISTTKMTTIVNKTDLFFKLLLPFKILV